MELPSVFFSSSDTKASRKKNINNKKTFSFSFLLVFPCSDYLCEYWCWCLGQIGWWWRSMAKQNVVLPEALSTKSSPMMYPPPRVKPTCNVRVPNGGGGKISNCLFETMKVSSPTHAVAATAAMAHTSAAEERNNIWKANHPSALSMLKEIVESSNGKEIIMFLDYDGTLSPIVDDPDKAFMSESMRAVVKNVAKCFPTAIVSGRCRDKVYNFVGLAELYYAGSHGMDIKGPANGPKQTKEDRAVLFQPASEFVPMIDEVYKILKKKTRVFEGAVVENNKFCLSVHYRCVEEKSWPSLADEVITVLKKYPKLKLTQGRKVLEIRPTIKWDKGKALEFLLESLGYADCKDVLPIYIGDDRTDEDAFKVLRKRGQGIGIIVSKVPKETNASYSLQEPSEVMDFLHRLVEWKRVSR